MPYRVYILINPSGRRYIGLSGEVAHRLSQHNDGVSKWTAKDRPWTLHWISIELSIRMAVESIDLKNFFEMRENVKREEHYSTRQKKFSFFIWTHFNKQGVQPQDIANPVGESKKKDMWTVSRQTVNAFRAGQHVIPKKFKLICRNLKIEKSERTIAKILYAEATSGNSSSAKTLTPFAG